jgi:hypothetical protein
MDVAIELLGALLILAGLAAAAGGLNPVPVPVRAKR